MAPRPTSTPPTDFQAFERVISQRTATGCAVDAPSSTMMILQFYRPAARVLLKQLVFKTHPAHRTHILEST